MAIERRGREDAEARLSEALKGRASAVAKALEAETKLAEALASKAGRVREEYPKYEDGAKIQLHSLKAKTEFNGQSATIICASDHRRHYEVRLDSGDTHLVHSRYIRPGAPQTEEFIIHSNALVLEAPAMFPGPPKIGTLQSGSSSDSSSVSIFDRPSGPSQLLAVSTAKEKKEKKDKKKKPEAAKDEANKIESALDPGAEAQEAKEAAEAPEVEADHAEAWKLKKRRRRNQESTQRSRRLPCGRLGVNCLSGWALRPPRWQYQVRRPSSMITVAVST